MKKYIAITEDEIAKFPKNKIYYNEEFDLYLLCVEVEEE